MKKSIKHLNWYYAIDVLAVSFVILLLMDLFLKKQKILEFLLIDSALLGLTSLVLYVEYKLENPPIPSKVTNNSGASVWAKPETGNTPLQIAPHGELYGVDGIKVNSKVYKLCSGTHVEIKANGEIVTKAFSAKLFNKIHGGYIDQSPDPNWDELFNA